MFEFQNYLSQGKFKEAEIRLSEQISGDTQNEQLIIQLETIRRLRKEFPYTRAELKEQLREYFPDLTDDDLNQWENDRQLEMRPYRWRKALFLKIGQ